MKHFHSFCVPQKKDIWVQKTWEFVNKFPFLGWTFPLTDYSFVMDRVVIVTVFVSQRRMFGSIFHTSAVCHRFFIAFTIIRQYSYEGQISEWWDDFWHFLLIEIHLNLISVSEQHSLHNHWAKVSMVCITCMFQNVLLSAKNQVVSEDHVTPRRWCRLSFSLRSLCHIFYDPVSKIWTTLH